MSQNVLRLYGSIIFYKYLIKEFDIRTVDSLIFYSNDYKCVCILGSLKKES